MPTNHFIARAGFELGPWHFGIFAIFSCQVQVKTKKKVLFVREAPGTVPYVKSDPVCCITFIKMLDEGLSYQLLG